jgi:hypothetical protein
MGAPCGFRVLGLMVPVYTPGVLRDALRFLIKSSYLYKKKRFVQGLAPSSDP